MCRATVNRVGICSREPCQGGGRYTTLQRPWEFENGRVPRFVPKARYSNPYRPQQRGPRSAYIKSLTIRSADVPGRVYSSSLRTKYPYIFLTMRMRSTITAEVQGMARSVTFYVNGRKGRTDYVQPYSIGGDFREAKTQKLRFSPWKFMVDRTVVVVSARVIGMDYVEHWRTIELSTNI